MKLKELLDEGHFDTDHPKNKSDEGSDEDNGEDNESCPGCGRMPGEGYGEACEDPIGCGYWKDWAREAAAEWKHDNRRESDVDEGVDFFDKYMAETLWIEDRKARQFKAPVIAESIGKVRQKRVQETPANRIRIGSR